jgi:hypothetical protein
VSDARKGSFSCDDKVHICLDGNKYSSATVAGFEDVGVLRGDEFIVSPDIVSSGASSRGVVFSNVNKLDRYRCCPLTTDSPLTPLPKDLFDPDINGPGDFPGDTFENVANRVAESSDVYVGSQITRPADNREQP